MDALANACFAWELYLTAAIVKIVQPGGLERSDERIELSNSAVLFVERKALWAGEGGLLGATVDLDEKFNLVITPKEPKEGT